MPSALYLDKQVNDFNRFGRTWQVNIQAEPCYRTDAEAVRQFSFRSRRNR